MDKFGLYSLAGRGMQVGKAQSNLRKAVGFPLNIPQHTLYFYLFINLFIGYLFLVLETELAKKRT